MKVFATSGAELKMKSLEEAKKRTRESCDRQAIVVAKDTIYETTAALFFGMPSQPVDSEPGWCKTMRDVCNERHCSSSMQNKIIDHMRTIHQKYLAANWTGPEDWKSFIDMTLTVLFTEGAVPCWEFLRDHIKNVMAVSLRA